MHSMIHGIVRKLKSSAKALSQAKSEHLCQLMILKRSNKEKKLFLFALLCYNVYYRFKKTFQDLTGILSYKSLLDFRIKVQLWI